MPAGSGNVHPVAVIRISSFGQIRRKGADSNHLVQGCRKCQTVGVVIRCRKDNYTSRHGTGLLARKGNACILNKIINRVNIAVIRYIITACPTVLGNDSPIVRCINKSIRCIRPIRPVHHLQSHDTHPRLICRAAGNATYPDAVAIHCGNSTGHVRAVGHGRNSPHLFFIHHNKVITVNIIHITVIIVINARLPVQFCLIDPHVVAKVGMVVLHSLVYDCHNNAGVTRLILPGIEKINISTFRPRRYLSRVVIMPLFRQTRVIERQFVSICLRPYAAGSIGRHQRKFVYHLQVFRNDLVVNRCHRDTLHFLYTGDITQVACSTTGGYHLVKIQIIPTVQPGFPVPFFKFACRAESPHHAISTQLSVQRIELRNAGFRPAGTGGCGLHLGSCFLRQFNPDMSFHFFPCSIGHHFRISFRLRCNLLLLLAGETEE